MARKKKALPVFEGIEITDIAAEGKSLVRISTPAHDGTPAGQLVVFVPWCVPGDIVDLKICRKKHSYAEAEVTRFRQLSDRRVEPRCQHFGTCGGCKWQQLPYEEQLRFKQQQVYDQLTRIGHLQIPRPGATSDDGQCAFHPIMGSVKQYEYRNKLDFSAANRRFLTKDEIASLPHDDNGSLKNTPALGFHITGAFDKVLPIEQCHLMESLHNDIRNSARDYALIHGIAFFDVREQRGLLRDVIIRNSNSGEWMVIVQFKLETPGVLSDDCAGLLRHIADEFPQVSSLVWVDNQKCNDTFGDLPVHVFRGNDHIIETMEDLQFKVGPKSFYQTNTEQAYHLYCVVREFAALSGTENVYDLYTGTGTIANFIARTARRVVGIEYVPEAIADAKVNSQFNGIDNALFYAGDMKDILTPDFIGEHGRPDVVITDPPRAGMHPDVVKTIREAAPGRIVYVSCNPATQARDLELLCADYRITRIQPVDMFPHTPHVENVVLLQRK